MEGTMSQVKSTIQIYWEYSKHRIILSVICYPEGVIVIQNN